MEYYETQRKLQKGQKRLNEKASDSEESTGSQEEIEINSEENGVIRFFDEEDPGPIK